MIVSAQYATDKLIEITDALLATPVSAMALKLDAGNVAQKLADLQERAGPHMAVGLSQTGQNEPLIWAQQADTPFLLTPHQNLAYLAALESSIAADTVLVPTALGWADVELLQEAGFDNQQVPIAMLNVNAMEAAPSVRLFANAADYHYGQLRRCLGEMARRQFRWLIVAKAVVDGPSPDMADIITKGRHLQAAIRMRDFD